MTNHAWGRHSVVGGGRVVAALALAAGLVATGSGPANANWSIQDGFEASPTPTWTLFHEGTGSGAFEINTGTAYRGKNNALLSSQTGWSSVRKLVYLSPANNNPYIRCNAAFMVKPLTGTVSVNVEVIDPATWNYLSVRTVTVSSTGYTTAGTDAWKVGTGPLTVVVRISLLGDGTTLSRARVDDMNVVCWLG